ncbi:MAG: sugar transferase [Clostridia bacterium]|nr:sugar transferase [Clostridia bacterium]
MYKRDTSRWMKHLDFILVDSISLQLACVLAYFLRFDGNANPYQDDIYARLALLLAVIDVIVCIVLNTMHNVLKRNKGQELTATLKHAFLVFCAMVICLVSTKTSSLYSRIVLYAIFILHSTLGYALRLLYKKGLLKRLSRESGRSIIVVADEANIGGILKKIAENANEMLRVTGLVLTNRDARGETIDGTAVVENLDAAADYICREWVDEIWIGGMYQDGRIDRLIRDCEEMGVVVHMQLPVEKSAGKKKFVEQLAGYTVLTSSVNYATPLEAAIKRVMDILGGLVGCALALVVIAIVGPKIKRASPGPIIYTQERVGQNGKRFRFYKIRSMYMDADERKAKLMKENRIADGMMFKLDFDPRIIGNEILPDGTKKTGIGAWIRETSLDEFPQFFNVLKGEMSLVGTRPPTVDEWEHYKLHHRMRLAVKPGITGMWQVSGRSEITNFEDVVKLDRQYICNWSLWLDVKILYKTVMTVLKRNGAM